MPSLTNSRGVLTLLGWHVWAVISHFKKAAMNRSILIVILSWVSSICGGQTLVAQVDGKLIQTEQSYFNDSLKKEASATDDYIGFYQKYISGIRGHECPMYPSCSHFGLKTFSEKNAASAFVMTSDRLLRCGHDHSNYS